MKKSSNRWHSQMVFHMMFRMAVNSNIRTFFVDFRACLNGLLITGIKVVAVWNLKNFK